MSIKQNGGVFGRNPTFNDVTIEGQLTFDGDIDINSDLKVDGNLEVDGAATINQDAVALAFKVTGGNGGVNVAEFSRDIGVDATVGINGNSGDPQIYFESPSNTFAIGTNSTVFEIADNNVIGTNTRFAISSVGDVSVSTGNLVIGTSGKGIDFSATAGTGTSELLDDYEEGTWSPVYAPQTGSFATMTMEVYDAVYTKIGNTVFISAFMRTDNVDMGTASGTLRITGLPFAPSSVVSTGGVEVSFAGAFGGDYPLSGWFESSYIQLSYRTSVNGTSLSSIVTDLTAGAVANKNTLRISGMYKTAS